MSDESTIALFVQVELEDGDPEELDSVTRQLRDEIQEMNVDSVRMATIGSAPEGTKSVDPVMLGALAVAVGPTFLTKLLEFLQDWVMRRENRTVKIKVQDKDGALLEVEIPATMPLAEAKDLIETMQETLAKKNAKK